MAGRIELLDGSAVPSESHRQLLVELHELYKAAGRPGLRAISTEIRSDNDLPQTLSHEAIRRVLRGVDGLPRWSTMKSLVSVLAKRAHPRRAIEVELERFLHLWEAAGASPGALVQNKPSDVQNPERTYVPEAVHTRLVTLMANALEDIPVDVVPENVRGFVRYAPNKHANLSTAVILAWLRDHHEFRAAVVSWCLTRQPDALDLNSGDPAAAAAAALLVDDEAASYYFAMTTKVSDTRRLPAAPVDLKTFLSPASTHMIVQGDEVFPHLAVEEQLDRLILGLATIAGRQDAEFTVVFDGSKAQSRPVAVPRGVRLLYSTPHQSVDDLMETLVNAEHLDRPVLVITANQCVIDLDDRPKAWYALPDELAEQIDRLHAEESTE